MESLGEENSILKKLHDFYSYHLQKSQENPKYKAEDKSSLTKLYILKIFFEYSIIDTCGYNIYQINEFLHQLNSVSEELNSEQFYKLIFFIYKTQTINQGVADSEISEISGDDINEISSNFKPIANNINIISLLVEQFDNNSKFFNYCVPDLSNEIFKEVVNYENLSYSSKYMNTLNKNIYLKYANNNKDKKIYYINIIKMNTFIIENNLNSLFKPDDLYNYMQLFLQIKSNLLDDSVFKENFLTFFEKNLKEEEIKDFFNKLDLKVESFNFNFSSIALLLQICSLYQGSAKNLPIKEKVQGFFEDILNLKNSDEVDLSEEKIEEEKKEEIVSEDYIPESETLNKAKENFGKYSKDDIEFVNEFLLILDKVLPPEDENILLFSNDYDYPTKKVYTNDKKSKIPKFPVERLAVEVEEEKERKIEEQEKKLIEKAKKAKKNQKEKVENPYDTVMGEVPNKQVSSERYLGHDKILTLTHRLIKHTFKEILPNSRVYPSLLKEVLIIPPLCPQKCIESIVESMEEQVNGRYELAIRRLEKAQEFLPKDNTQIDWQTDLFFNLSFGSLYDTLGYDLMALKYYYESTRITEKLIGADTDTSLPYCFLGELFVKLQEYNWALRCFLKAKKIREETIGGETPDTAATYNNLGVVAYCMESYLPAKGFFKLAYEIYKSLLGLTHPRTMLIKSNLSKMNQLNFNKEIEFKTLSKYATPAQLIKNPKKKK
jgi:hypothetical protein